MPVHHPNFQRSLLKFLGRAESNFIRSIIGRGFKVFDHYSGVVTKMGACKLFFQEPVDLFQ